MPPIVRIASAPVSVYDNRPPAKGPKSRCNIRLAGGQAFADTGHGISPMDFRRLFQPYFSTRGTGTGLGLAIVQRIILEHRGRIRAETNYPRGARFIVEMPAVNA